MQVTKKLYPEFGRALTFEKSQKIAEDLIDQIGGKNQRRGAVLAGTPLLNNSSIPDFFAKLANFHLKVFAILFLNWKTRNTVKS